MTIRNYYREKCTGCGICVAACPMDVLRMDKNEKRRLLSILKIASPVGVVSHSARRVVLTSPPNVAGGS